MQRKTLVIIGTATAVVLAGGAAVAKFGPRHQGGHGGKVMKEMFATADTDGDKAISTAEFKSFIDGHFMEADANKDGKVTKGEAVTAIETQANGKRMARRAGRMGDLLVNRFDINRDGTVEKAEFDSRTGKM